MPIRLHPAISLEEIEEALQAWGLHLRDDGGGRLFVERVPRFLLDVRREGIRAPSIITDIRRKFELTP